MGVLGVAKGIKRLGVLTFLKKNEEMEHKSIKSNTIKRAHDICLDHKIPDIESSLEDIHCPKSGIAVVSTLKFPLNMMMDQTEQQFLNELDKKTLELS